MLYKRSTLVLLSFSIERWVVPPKTETWVLPQNTVRSVFQAKILPWSDMNVPEHKNTGTTVADKIWGPISSLTATRSDGFKARCQE